MNDASIILIIIGLIFALFGLILFIKGVGNGDTNKVKFFGAEVESKAPSLIIFVIGATLIFYGGTNKKKIDAPVITKTIKEQMDSIGSTGWIFLGYYDLKQHHYTASRHYYETDRTTYPVIPDSINLHTGDILTLQVARSVKIVGYKKNKQNEVFSPPLADLTPDDDTGVSIPKGERVQIEDLSITNYPNRPYAVWARIRLEVN